MEDNNFYNKNKATHLKLGEKGEDFACEFLKKNKHKIIARNYQNKFFEIDIITKKKNVIHFVEVRSKSNEKFGSPEETVNWEKKRKLVKSAKSYVALNNYNGNYQIDLVCIVFNKGNNIKRLNYYENIEL